MSSHTFAVLIPAHNEEVVIDATIDSLLAADIPLADIHIVDDQSTDATARIVRDRGVKCFTTPENCGKAQAQTLALAHFELLTSYDWVICLDGDTKVSPGFYAALKQAAAAEPDTGLFVGQVKSARASSIYSAARAAEYAFSHDVIKQGQSNFNVIFVSPGCASMYRTDVLSQLHIDHLTLAEDMDLTMQVHRLGYRVTYVDAATVHTQDPATFKDYHKQVLRWSRGMWQVVKKHKVFGLQRKTRVDLYMMLLLLEALLLNRFVGLAIVALLSLPLAGGVLLVDFGLSLLVSVYASIRTKRLDVLYKQPIYYWLTFVNLAVFIRAFFEIIVLRRTILAWNKVARYTFEQVS